MKTEKIRFEINTQSHLVIYLKDLLKKDSKEIPFTIMKENLPKLKEILK